MTTKELLDDFVNGKMSFGEAKAKLKQMGKYMNDDEYDKIDLCLETLREVKEVERGVDHDPMDHQPRPLEVIPSAIYLDVFFFCVQKILDGYYAHNIGNLIYDEFGIGSGLATYFYNEALDMVRLNNLTPEQISEIGEEYMKAKFAEMISNGALKIMKEPTEGEV